MPATTEVERTRIDQSRYEALVAAPPVIPTPEEIFDHQVGILAEQEMASSEELERLRVHLPKTGLFIVVPRRPENLNWNHLMSLVVVDGRAGKNYLDPAYLADLVEVPKTPYLCLDVEDGRKVLGKSVRRCREIFQTEGRSGLIIWEGFLLILYFPEILKHHYIDAGGSRCFSGSTPCFRLGGGRPGLYDGSIDYEYSHWGSASCGSRVGL